jgi:hypothetical protein
MTKLELEASLAALETWIQLFGILVAVGIVGEVGVGVRHWILNRRLQAVQHTEDVERQAEVARATERASTAEATAKGFESQIADSNARAKSAESTVAVAKEQAAKAELGTAQARLELAKIQERMADRKLTDAQVKNISDAVRPFAGQEFDVTPYWDLPESLTIANRIADALMAGGWKYVAPEKSGFMLGGISGVQVWTHPTADDKIKRAAESLLAALNRENVVSVARTQNPANPPDSKLHLNVGTKP